MGLFWGGNNRGFENLGSSPGRNTLDVLPRGCRAFAGIGNDFSSANPFEFDSNQVWLMESVVRIQTHPKRKIEPEARLAHSPGRVYSFTSPSGEGFLEFLKIYLSRFDSVEENFCTHKRIGHCSQLGPTFLLKSTLRLSPNFCLKQIRNCWTLKLRDLFHGNFISVYE